MGLKPSKSIPLSRLKVPPADLAEAHESKEPLCHPVSFFSSLVPFCSELQAALQGLTHALLSVFVGIAFLVTHRGHRTTGIKEFSVRKEGTAGFKKNSTNQC